MRAIADDGTVIVIGATEAAPTIGIVDYSRRETDDFGVTTVVRRGFARTMSVRVRVASDDVDHLQRQLADLRAKPVRWIADDRFDSLSIKGFFKEFSIDLAVPPVSFCTLTIEGLAQSEGFIDPGTDPAPGNRPSSLRLLQPAAIDDVSLLASSVPEDDYPEWDSEVTYGIGARVVGAATHRIYESATIGNVGNDPAGASGLWIDLGPTNRWAMFDQALGSVTQADGQVSVTLAALQSVNAVALLDVKAAAVRVQAFGYDRTQAPAAPSGMVTFFDLPDTIGSFTVTVEGPGAVSIGTLLFGPLMGLGITEASPTAGITDYSRKETDEFGEVTVVERAWAKRMNVRGLIDTAALDVVAGRIASVRAVPSLWIGDDAREAITVYGFFKDFSIEVGDNVSTLSLSVEGLSAAAKITPLQVDPGDVSWGDIVDDDPAHPKPQDGATVGAPDDAPVGGTTAYNVIQALLALGSVSDPDEIVSGAHALIDRTVNHSLALFDIQLLNEERKARWERLTHLGGVEVTTRVRNEITERIEGDSAIIERVDEIEVAATDGINAAMAAISDEATARAAADTAETAQRELAISQVQIRIDDEVQDIQAAILSEAETRASADLAETEQRELAVSSIHARIDDEVLDIEAAISAEAITRADADSAETSARELAISTFQHVVDGQISTVTASIEAEASTRADADSAETQARELAISTVRSDLGGDIADVTAAIESEATTRASADAAETLARQQAISQIEIDLDDEVETIMAAIASEAQTRADADSAEASLREALVASIDGRFGDIDAAILNEAQVRADGDSAEATAREALAATLSGDIGDVSAAVESEATARAAGDGALASILDGVQTTVDGNTASVLMLLESVDGLSARAGLRLDVNGKITGYVLNNDGQEGRFDVLADYFGVTSDDGAYSFAQGRQTIVGGAVMTISGRPFGSANQFIEWTGPVVSDLSACTETNAIKYVDVAGNARFNGSLSSGILKNEGTSTTVSPTAFIIVGPFQSMGAPINVNMAASFVREQTADAGSGSISGTGGGTLALEWSSDGSSWTLLTTIGANENERLVIVDGDPTVRDVLKWSMAAAGTFTWTAGALAGVLIRLRWTAFSQPSLNGTNMTFPTQTQRTGVIAIEQP